MKKVNLPFMISLIVLAFAGCNYGGKKDPLSKETLKIGAIVPLTGNLAFLGESANLGFDFAKFYFKKVDSTRQVEFFVEDGQGNPTNSINALNKLLDVDKVKIIFSTISSVELSLVPIQEKKLFMLISHSTHPNLSNLNNLVFRHSPTVSQEVELIRSRINSSDKVVVCFMTDDYGVTFDSALKNSAKSNQLTSFGFQKGEINFNSIAQKVVKSKPDKIILCAGGSNLKSFVQKIRELNCNAQIITTLAFTVSGAAENLGNITNVLMVRFKPLVAQAEFASYLSEYEILKGKKLGTSELLFFNSALLIYKCSAISIDVTNISNEIKSKPEYELLGETVMISSTNDILPNLEFIEK
ncbi:MAG: ABC transporter substrate-binding protein [Haliscomenobacter sp.]|nr:ABC transporter substrate-binding protein [Haliscomenobacter sp.]